MANRYHIKDDHVIIEVYGTKISGEILIDLDDLEKVQRRIWHIKSTTVNGENGRYVVAKINNKQTSLHRFIMDVDNPKQVIDHINRNVLDNRKSNLRLVNHTINNLNTRFSKNNTSGRTGVKLHKGQNGRSDSWVGTINYNGKRKQKQFSIELYGYEEAFKLAEEFRIQGEKKYDIRTDKTFND